MHYQTFYDVSRASDPNSFILLISAIAFALFLICLIWGWKNAWNPKWLRIACGLFIVSAISWIFYSTAHESFKNEQSLIVTKKSQTVTGNVNDFSAVHALGEDKMDSFCVNGVCFKYWCCQEIASLPTNRKDSPIHNGLPIRVTYVDGTIIKLEIGQDSEQQNKN